MPQSQNTPKFKHARTENVALPYISNTSPVGEPLCYIPGSQDVLTSIDNTARQRPGFTVSPSTVTQINHTTDVPKRYFFWQKSDGTSFILLSATSGAHSRIYKIKVGTDTDWQTLTTDTGTTEPYDYTVSHDFLYFFNGTSSGRWDGATLSTIGIAAPTTFTSVTNVGAGNVPNAIRHTYVFAYGDSSVGYISDISAESKIVPAGGINSQWTLVGPRCTNARCDKVHIYRTEDGGATPLELSNSPIANPGAGTWTITDNDADSDLLVSSPAPLRFVNSVPPAMFQPTIFAGRIWGFKGDTVYYSTLEENNTSVPEECYGTATTNSYRFGRPVNGLGVTGGNPSYLCVFTNRGLWQISGDSLVTFARNNISKVHGVHYRQNIAEDDKGNVVFYDVSSTVLVTDGTKVGDPDVTLPIRPDVANVAHSTAQLILHRDGKRKWIILMDGSDGSSATAASTFYVFDIDRKVWMPPWKTITGATCIASNAVFPTGVLLYIARFGRSMAMDETKTQDDDPTTPSKKLGFDSELRFSLQQINKENPVGLSDVEYIAAEQNSQLISDVQLLMDDDPATGTFSTIINNAEDPDQRRQGGDLIEKWYWNRTAVSPGQRVSVKLKWSGSDVWAQPWKFYSFDIAHNVVK